MTEDYQPVEIDAQEANTATLALNNLAGDMKMADMPLGDALRWFAEEYGQHRVESPHDDAEGTVVLSLPPETYRTIAAGLRMEALRRNAGSLGGDIAALSEKMADDYREIARTFDKAARRAET